MSCSNNLKQIALALHNYHDVYKQFPPAAIGPKDVPVDRQFSWMVALLPFLEQQAFYDEIRLDLPWDHPLNAGLLQIGPSSLFCPSDPTPTTSEGYPKTSYVAVTGADQTAGTGQLRGVIGFDRGLSLSEVSDGTSNTIVVAEVTDGGPWFAAGFGTARRIDAWTKNKSWSYHPGGGNFAYADGSVQFLSTDTDLQTLRALATARGLERPVQRQDTVTTGTDTGEATVEPMDEQTMDEQTMDEQISVQVALAKESREAEIAFDESVATAKETTTPTAMVRGDRARLSLRLELPTSGQRPVGLRRDGNPQKLVVELQDTALVDGLRWVFAALALLVAWLLRDANETRKAMAIIAGLVIPIAGVGLVPLAWTPLLDGVLLGTLAAGCLWLLRKLVRFSRHRLAQRPVALFVLSLILLGAGQSSVAQQPQDLNLKAAPLPPPDLTLFIPYSRDDDPLESSQVYLPYDQYLQLWRQAHPGEQPPGDPDVPVVVSRAQYVAKVDGDVARIDGRFLVHHVRGRWVRVELPLGAVALEQVTVDGQPATLSGEQHDQDPRTESAEQSPDDAQPLRTGRAAVYLEKPGLHVVDVQLRVPVSRLGETGRLTIPLLEVASGQLVVELPAEDLDVQVTGAPGGWRRQSAAVGTDQTMARGRFVRVPLGNTKDLSVRWQPRQQDAQMDKLVTVDQLMLVQVLDSGVHHCSSIHYRIQQGSLGELQLQVPPDMSVQQVTGPDVAAWSIRDSDQPAQRQLIVSLKAESNTSLDLTVESFQAARQDASNDRFFFRTTRRGPRDGTDRGGRRRVVSLARGASRPIGADQLYRAAVTANAQRILAATGRVPLQHATLVVACGSDTGTCTSRRDRSNGRDGDAASSHSAALN